MIKLRRKLSFLLAVLLVASVFPMSAFATTEFSLGNTDINILNDGIMLTDGDDFYYSENGKIYHEYDGSTSTIVQEAGKNLNLVGEELYFTTGTEVKAVSVNGGVSSVAYTHFDNISGLYVVNDTELRFIAGGYVYSYQISTGELTQLYQSENVMGLIPTAYGDILLTGEVFDYDLKTGDTTVLTCVTSCYTDSGYLVLSIDTRNYQVSLEKIFSGSFSSADLEVFNLHEGEDSFTAFDCDDGTCEVCEENAKLSLVSGFEADDTTYAAEYDEFALMAETSAGQDNIVKRARQMHEVAWTPILDRYQWGYAGTFYAGTTYTGIPYGQPVNTGYVGFAVTIDGFLTAVETSTSVFYTGYSTYNKIAPYYSSDCSAFVSYALGISRTTTAGLPGMSTMTKVSDQSIYSLQVGDIMNKASNHVVLVVAVRSNASGTITSIDILEQTPVKTKYTRYGEGGTATLASLTSKYINSGYTSYRYNNRDSVKYTHSCAVPLDNEQCASCKVAAPVAATTSYVGCKAVTLSHTNDSAVIYYTTDGSTPTASSKKYTGETISITSTTRLRAMATLSGYSASRYLDYTVTVTAAGTPKISATNNKVTISCSTSSATIYYTTDGSTPTTASKLYTGEFSMSGSTTVKAIAVAKGYKTSAVGTATLVFSETPFSDVSTSSWYYNAVKYAYVNGLFSGTSDTTFSPDSTMTRGMFVTVLGRYAGVSSSLASGVGVTTGTSINVRSAATTSSAIVTTIAQKYTAVQVTGTSGDWYALTYGSYTGYIRSDYLKVYSGNFKDVKASQYYRAYVEWAYLTSVVNGTSATTFTPDGSITREQMCVMMYNYAKQFGISLPSTNAKASFADDTKISSWAKTAVYAMQQAGIVGGKGNNIFDPQGTAIRAEVAQVFMNFAEALG